MQKKKNWIIGLAVLGMIGCVSVVYAAEKTSTGFYWPIGESDFDSAHGSWLERDSDNGGNYFGGLYHIGIDMMTRTTSGVDSEVYAISDGEIVYKHCDDYSWGPGNCALFIQHKLTNGNKFIALYGHLRTSLTVGNKVYAGKFIGRTGPYSGGIHLHFGIVPESNVPGTNVSQGIGWGRMSNQHWNKSWPNKTNHFVDPINFLNTHHPANYLSYFYVSEGDTHIAWSPSNVPCEKAWVWAYNQTCSAQYSKPETCRMVYNELLQEDYNEYSQEKYRTMFFGDVNDFQQFCQ